MDASLPATLRLGLRLDRCDRLNISLGCRQGPSPVHLPRGCQVRGELCGADPHSHVYTADAVLPGDDGIEIQLADLREIIREPGDPQKRIREPGGVHRRRAAGRRTQLQYALVYAIDCSGVTGKPHSRMSSVVCASETSVAS